MYLYYFYNNSVLLYAVKYLSKYLLIYLVSTQISVTQIQMTQPGQYFCRHPNTGDAALNVLRNLELAILT